jgi:hypothetical protein
MVCSLSIEPEVRLGLTVIKTELVTELFDPLVTLILNHRFSVSEGGL